MRKVLLLVLVIVGAFVLWRCMGSDPPAVKEYKEYRRAKTKSGVEDPNPILGYAGTLAGWRLDVEDVKTEGDTVSFRAVEHTSILGIQGGMRQRILTYEVQLRQEGGRWQVVGEEVVDEDYKGRG